MSRPFKLRFRARALSFALFAACLFTSIASVQAEELVDPSSVPRSRIWLLPSQDLMASSANTGFEDCGTARIGRILGRNGTNIIFWDEETQVVEEVAIHRITRTDMTKTGRFTGPGMVFGGIAGGIIGSQVARADDVENCVLFCDLAQQSADQDATFTGIVVGTLVGASVGAILGSMVEYEFWERVHMVYGFLSPASASGPTNARPGLALTTHFD